jgi:uncharacterized membrane protein
MDDWKVTAIYTSILFGMAFIASILGDLIAAGFLVAVGVLTFSTTIKLWKKGKN